MDVGQGDAGVHKERDDWVILVLEGFVPVIGCRQRAVAQQRLLASRPGPQPGRYATLRLAFDRGSSRWPPKLVACVR